MTRIEGSAPAGAVMPNAASGEVVPLEPVRGPSDPKPFRPDTDTWIDVGAGAFFGAAAGGIAGLAGLSVFGPNASARVATVVGLGTAALGGWIGARIAYVGTREGHERREQERVQGEFGTSTLEHARTLMTKFDHDDNGRIDLVNRTGLDGRNERIFTETREQSDTRLKYDWFDDDWDTETTRWTESRGVSAAALWREADVDPKDRVVSDVELARVLARYDADRSGTLTEAERSAFDAAHPLDVEDWHR